MQASIVLTDRRASPRAPSPRARTAIPRLSRSRPTRLRGEDSLRDSRGDVFEQKLAVAGHLSFQTFQISR